MPLTPGIGKFCFFSSRRRHTRWPRDWSSDVCSSDLSQLRLRIVAGMAFGLMLVLVGQGLNQRLLEFPRQVQDWHDRNSESSRWKVMQQHGWEESDFQFQQFERKLLSGELRGFYSSPNTYAAMLVMCGLIAFGILMQRLRDGDGIGWVVVIVMAMIGAAFVLWHTHSRTAAITP